MNLDACSDCGQFVLTSLLPQCALLLQRCNITARGGCPICKRIANLIPLHARACRNEACVVPQCREIKEHLRQNAMRQQNMDDERRRMMNEMYARRPEPVPAPAAEPAAGAS